MPGPTIDCGSPPEGAIGVPYTHTLPTTHDSVFTVAITGGALPPGLGMDSTGVISGTPTAAGAFSFTATITEPDASAPVFLPLSGYLGTTFINESDGALRAYGDTPGVNRISPTRWQIAVLNGPVTWSLIGGPITPVSSTTSSYTFDFIPTVQGDYSFTLKATNSVGSTTQTFTIGVGLYPSTGGVGTIGPFDQFLMLTNSGEHVIGPAFIGNLLAADGWTNPFAPGIAIQLYSSGGPGNTPNFAINVNTGPGDIGYGVAALGTYSIPVIGENTAAIPLGTVHFTITFSVLATRPSGGGTVSASVDCSITIGGTTIDCGDPPVGLVGAPYSHIMPSTATGTFTVHVTGGALPDGLTMNASGAITGVPTAPGAFPFTATITDAVGTAAVNCSITINASTLGLLCAQPPNGVVGTAYDYIFPVTGGVPPFTFSIVSGSLPPGLTLDAANGEVSGTPTLAGDYNFGIEVSDDFGSVIGHCEILITVTDLPIPGITCDSPPDGELGVPYSHTFPVTDIPSGATVSYAITGGALPPGLTLNTATGEVTGTPTTDGHYHFTLTLTVSEPDGGGGATIRGGNAVWYGSASSFTVAFPAGSQAGDTAILQVAGGSGSLANPTGWTQLFSQGGTVWNGYIGTKILTSGDISTGSVTVTAAGSFNGESNIVVLEGAVTIREVVTFATVVLGVGTFVTSGAVQSTDLGIGLASQRQLNIAPTFTPGTALVTASDGVDPTFKSSIYSIPMSTGANTITSNTGGSNGNLNWQAAVIVVEA